MLTIPTFVLDDYSALSLARLIQGLDAYFSFFFRE